MDFKSFFFAVNGQSPFPWQVEAARRLLDGAALKSLSVPTGCGKTAMIDAALYCAAHGGPRRIFFIIDRRIVVDDAFRRADQIRRSLENTDDTDLKALAQRLGRLRVVRLRGGVSTDPDWVWHPEDTVVVLSTVDQVGSRLLFRGYGVAPRSWPLHAAFVGNKALYILDEAHLSQPFAHTIQSTIRHGADIRLITMTATPGAIDPHTLSLSEDDYHHPTLSVRLGTKKQARLTTTGSTDREFAAAMADAAETYATAGAVVGVVANTVKAARAVFEVLRRRKQDAVLLTGRTRPFDRDRLINNLLPRIKSGRDRPQDGSTLFVVATQTIEVGADLDFDALITEAAPLSALRQRFGRLDRLGVLNSSSATICARERDIDSKKAENAPVYGADLSATWNWLQSVAKNSFVDFGPQVMMDIMESMPPPVERQPNCPALLTPHLAVLAQTGPTSPGIDPAPWLHGPQQRDTEISVVWRSDIDLTSEDPGKIELAKEQIRLLPPQLGEALQIPIPALKDLFTGTVRTEIGDLDQSSSNQVQISNIEALVLRWRGRDDCEVVSVSEVRPGDTVVVSTAVCGGLDEFGWAPGSKQPVLDVAEACTERDDRTSHVLRLNPKCRPLWRELDETAFTKSDSVQIDAAVSKFVDTLKNPEIENDEEIRETQQALKKTLAAIPHPLIQRLGNRYQIALDAEENVYLISGKIMEEGGATNAGKSVLLDDHGLGTAETAARLCEGDPNEDDIINAANGHDLGKQVFPFQAMLYGHPTKVNPTRILAKSGIKRPDALRASFLASGLPKHFRHELHSVELCPVQNSIVHHLIGSHHGHGRPWFPKCSDSEAPGAHLAAIESGWSEQFAELRRQYGVWRLAELELLVRSADIRRTQAEQET